MITGAGIIAIEYAKIFTKLGAKVTMLVRRAARDSIARLGLDEDIVSALLGDLKESGVTVQASHTHTHTHTQTHALAVTPHRHTHALAVRTVILSHPYARTSSADARAFLRLASTLTPAQTLTLTHTFALARCDLLHSHMRAMCALIRSRSIRPPQVRKTASCFEFSLCLSRACLGKMIV